MKKLLAVLSIAVAAATLTACSTGPDQGKVDAYRTVVHAIPGYEDLPNTSLEKTAKAVCGVFKANESGAWRETMQSFMDNGSSEAQGEVFVRGGVAAYCPQYVKDLPAQ